MRPFLIFGAILAAVTAVGARERLIDEQPSFSPVSATLVAFDPDNGIGKTLLKLDGQSIGHPALAGDAIFIATSAKKVLAFDSATGHIRWEYSTKFPVFSLLATTKDLFVGAGGTLLSLDPANGTVRWRFEGDMALLDPILADAVVIINAVDGPIAIDANTGKVRWRLNVQWGYFICSPLTDHRLCVWKPDEIYMIDTESGKTLWKSAPDSFVSAPGALPSPAVAAADVIGQLRGSRKDPRDWSLFALDAGSGQTLWKTNLGDFHGAAARTLIAGKSIYCLLDETVIALDLTSGDKKWQAAAKPLETSGVGMSANADTLFVPQIGGDLLALDAKTGQRKWVDESTAPARKNSARIAGLLFADKTGYVAINEMARQ